MNKLESEELRNRYPGTEGNDKTAAFLLKKIQNAGLKPLNGIYKQDFTITTGIKLKENNSVELTKLVERPGLPKERWGKATKKWSPRKEYIPISFSANGTVEGEMVFVGYGITAHEIGYDDYSNVDVTDKIVVVLSDSCDGKPLRPEFLPYSWLRYKAKNAKEHGAKAIIFIKTLSDSANTFYPLLPEDRSEDIGIIAIQVNRTDISKYFPRHANLYPSEVQLQGTLQPNSFNFVNSMIKITVNIGVEEKVISNIIGVVPGTDESKSEEYIVITANFDNLGPQARTEEYKRHFPNIFNDEKSTGFACMIALIDMIKESPLTRPVVFVGFNAKVFAFSGAEQFINNSIIPISNIFTLINMDKVGKMNRSRVSILGASTASVFTSILEESAKELELKIEEPRSKVKGDYTMFYYQNVPILRISSGYEFNLYSRRHATNDINYKGMARLVDFTSNLLHKLDELSAKPIFEPNSLIMTR